MSNTEIIYLVASIIKSFMYIVFFAVVIYFVIVPIVNRILSLKEKEVKNKQAEIYNSIDITSTEDIVNNYFQKYIDRYIIYKFISNKVMYIRQPEVDEMIKDITKSIALNISELYVYYIKLLQSVSTEEELITFIHDKVMNLSIEAVSNFNKTLEN